VWVEQCLAAAPNALRTCRPDEAPGIARRDSARHGPDRINRGTIAAVASQYRHESVRVLDQDYVCVRVRRGVAMSGAAAAAASGHLFVVSAPSGGGKTSLVRALLERAGNLRVSTSHTTRARRAGERDGIDYHFVDQTAFQSMVEAGEFLEHARVFDHYYGTARAPVAERLGAGEDVILEIDWQGARTIRAAMAATISIFILPPSIEELERRLNNRGDKPENIVRRMRDAVNEMSHFGEYDYLVINDDFERAAASLVSIVSASRLRREVQVQRHAAMLGRLVAP
jgi:guanylate kinase